MVSLQGDMNISLDYPALQRLETNRRFEPGYRRSARETSQDHDKALLGYVQFISQIREAGCRIASNHQGTRRDLETQAWRKSANTTRDWDRSEDLGGYVFNRSGASDRKGVGASDVHKTSKISDKILGIQREAWYGDTTCSGFSLMSSRCLDWLDLILSINTGAVT